MTSSLLQQLHKVLPTLDGWCRIEKAEMLIRCVRDSDAQLCVEIGVFGGSSLIPQALALQAAGRGKIIGIDPYSRALAVAGQDPIDAKWWGAVDLQKIRSGFLSAVTRLQLKPFVELMEADAYLVHELFKPGTIDVLHVDGNHSAEIALRDVQTYLPKVRPGGFVCLDDISWGFKNHGRATTGDAVEFALSQCRWLGVIDECLFLQKR